MSSKKSNDENSDAEHSDDSSVSSDMEETAVFYPENIEEYNDVKRNTKDKLVVINHSSLFCETCKKMSVEFEKLATENPVQVFMKIDVDNKKFSSLDGRKDAKFRFFYNNNLLDECCDDVEKLKTIFNTRKNKI